MNREIKFRAWDKIDDIMLMPKIGMHFPSIQDDMPNKNCILMQFTGLQDKNGADIYEGDVIKYINPDYAGNRESVHVCMFGKIQDSDGYCQDYNLGFGLKKLNGESICGFYNYGTYEVVGNIHENPELLND